ncbi:MAG: phosphohydrolase, partial [Opitutaceae bacterium]
MSVKNQFKLLLGGLGARRGTRPPHVGAAAAMGEFLDRSRLVGILIFIVTVAAIVLISSAGVSTLDAPVVVGQVATSRVNALVSFSYESAEKTRVAREQFMDQLPPVYRLDVGPLAVFEGAARLLLGQLSTFESPRPADPAVLVTRRGELTRIADTFNAQSPAFHATAEDIAAVLSAGDAKQRADLFENGLATLRDIYAQGVTDSALGMVSPGSSVVFQIARASGEIAQRPVQTMEDALTVLRVSLAGANTPRPAAQAIFRLFRYGLTPNISFDREATRVLHDERARNLKPVIVTVARGQLIINAGEKVTAGQHEMLVAHRKYVRDHTELDASEGLTLFGRMLLVLAMVLASLIYIRIEDPETLRSNVRCGLL